MSESPAFSLFWEIDEAKGTEIPYYIFSPGPERSHGRVYAADWLRHTGLFLINTLPLLPPMDAAWTPPGLPGIRQPGASGLTGDCCIPAGSITALFPCLQPRDVFFTERIVFLIKI